MGLLLNYFTVYREKLTKISAKYLKSNLYVFLARLLQN